METSNNLHLKIPRDDRHFHNGAYWRVIVFYLLVPMVTASIVLISSYGHISIKLMAVILVIYLIVSLQRIIQDLFKPKEILFYEDSLHIILSCFKLEREWTILYCDLSVVCIGYGTDKKRKRVVLQDKKRIEHGCSLGITSGWDSDLQSIVITQLEEIAHISPSIKS